MKSLPADLCTNATSNEIGDSSLVGPLLEQIQSPMSSVTADGAYDGEPVYRALAARQPQLPPAVIIPPRVTAVLRSTTETSPKNHLLGKTAFLPYCRQAILILLANRIY